MKKIILIIVSLIFLMCGNSFAQDKKYSFGLKGSPTIAWLKPDISISNKQKALIPATSQREYTSEGMMFGFSYGFMLEMNLSDNYAFATGFDVTYNGGKLKYPHEQKINLDDSLAETGTLLRKFSLKYLEIPLMLKMKTNEIGYLTYFGQFGFGTSFNLSASADDKFEYTNSDKTPTEEDIDIKEENEISFFRESLIIGIGVEYSLGGDTKAIVGVNFNNGFTDILKGDNNILSEKNLGEGSELVLKEKAISNYIELNIGIMF